MPNPSVAREQARRRKVEELRRQEQASRRRRLSAFGAVGTVVLVVIALVIAKAATGGKSTAASAPTSTAAASTVAQVVGVPQTVLDTVGVGTVSAAPQALSGAPALTSAGRPEVVYLGAEYCPFCAAERWAVVQALSRFGTFTGLGETSSSSSDVYPSTPTLSFHGATYTSDYLAFRGFEETTNQPDGNGGYTKLDTVPADVVKLAQSYDKQGSIPFVDLGGKSTIVGATYDPQVLAGKTQAQVAAALSDPSSAIAKSVLGAANAITARLCDLTGNKPANVCTSSAVVAARGGS